MSPLPKYNHILVNHLKICTYVLDHVIYLILAQVNDKNKKHPITFTIHALNNSCFKENKRKVYLFGKASLYSALNSKIL